MHRNIFEEDHEIFRDSVTRFLQAEVQPHLDGWLEAGIIDRELFKKAGEQGYCLMWADEAYGGMGVHDFRFEQILIEENAHPRRRRLRAVRCTAACARPYLGQLGSDEQKQRFLPGCISGETILGIAMTEPGAGSDVAGIRTMAVDQDDHWVLNGSKIYISNGINGDCSSSRRAPCRTIRTASACSWSSAAWKASTRGRNLKKLGLKSQDTAELFFDNVQGAEGQRAGRPAQGLLLPDAVPRRGAADRGRAAAWLRPRRRLRITIEYVKERAAFGKAHRGVPEHALQAGRHAHAGSMRRRPSSTAA